MSHSVFKKVLPFLLFGAALGAQEVGEGKKSCTLSQRSETSEELRRFCGLEEPKCGCFARSCSNASGMALEFDFLWWLSENHGFSVGLNESSDGRFDPNNSNSTNIGAILRVHPNWDPGFKLGLGWNTDYDRWDLFANWTWYRNHAKTTTVRSDIPIGSVSNDGLYPTWPSGDSSLYGPYRRAFSSWKMLYNAIDLELGRAYFATRYLAFKPQWGVRGSWIHQKFVSSFTQFLQTAGFSKQDFHGKNNWWGVGPRLGLQGDWLLGKGLRVLGRTNAALLYGKTSVFYLSEKEPIGSSNLIVDKRFIDSFYALVPNLQLYMGFGWGQCFCCDKLYIGVDAGWEVNYWWNQFNMPIDVRGLSTPLPTIGNQPVTMEGLTLNFHLDY